MKRERVVTATIRKKIKSKGPGATFSYADFRGLPFSAVAQTLSRLVKDGVLVRARKGIYHYPKKTALGETLPRVADIIDKTTWSHRLMTMAAGSSLASYNLGITTQVPAETVLIGNYPNRTIEILGTKVRTVRRDTSHLKHLGEVEFYLIETLRNFNKLPAVSPGEVIKTLKKRLMDANVDKLTKAALKEPPRVRALLGALLTEIRKPEAARSLKASLNPLTTYKFGIEKYLKSAKDWGIK